ncbi:signal peptidase I [Vibrio sp. JCM 18904]|nr:signal peptidase I [Vibrio sp. JCM 18904]
MAIGKAGFREKRQEKLAEIQAQTSNGLDAVTLQKLSVSLVG